jgi:tetratricopeptide (TPR) repeat protein
MTATASEATGQSVDRVYQVHGSTSARPLALAISGNDPGCLEELLVSSVKETVAPIRQVTSSFFPLAEQLFAAISKTSFDVLIVIANPNWGETSLKSDALRDRELLCKLRSRSSVPLIVIHNGCAGHKEESLRAVGVDLVLPMPFEISTLQQFLSTRFKVASQDSQSEPVQEKRRPIDTCESLLDAATKDLFRKNAFRITGLPVDATARDVAKHSEKLKMLAELGQNLHVQSGYFSLKPAPSLDDIRDATQKLKDPEKRMVDEFYWFWPEEFGKSQSDPAMEAVKTGDSNAAIKIWDARENGEVPSVIAKHNLALAYHIRALDWENYCIKNEVDAERREKINGYWKGAFNRWQSLATDDRLWEMVSARIRQLNEPNLTTGFARRMRATLPQALGKINAELALALAESGKVELAHLHIRFMRGTSQDLDNVEKIAELVLTPARNRLKDRIQRAEEVAKKNPQDTASAAKELLHQAQCAAFLFDLFFGKDGDFRNDLFDEVAAVCNRLQVAYHNATDDDKTCLEILSSVLPLATSIEIRQQIEKNIAALRGFTASKTLGPVYELLKSIQESKERPRTRLDKFQRTLVTAIDTAMKGLADGSDEKNQLSESAAIVLRGISLEAWNQHQDGTAAVAANLLAARYACTADLKRQLVEDKTTLAQNIGEQTVTRRRKLRSLAVIGAIFAVVLVSALFSNNTPSSSKSSSGRYSAPSAYTASTSVGASNPVSAGAQTEPQSLNGPGTQTPESYLNVAFQRYSEGRYAESVEACRLALGLRPGYAEAWNILGAAYHGLKRDDEAAEAFENALRFKPDFEFAQKNLQTIRSSASYTTSRSTSYSSPSFPSWTGANSTSDASYRVPSSVATVLDREKAANESERATLETSEAEIQRLGREIEGERLYLDQSNPYIVQQFNVKVDRYNALLRQDKAAMAVFNAKVDSYNAKLRQYGR